MSYPIAIHVLSPTDLSQNAFVAQSSEKLENLLFGTVSNPRKR